MPALTDADGIEIEAFYDGAMDQDWSSPTDHIDVSRWTQYGHDRLYINDGIAKADKYDLYVDLQTHEIVSNNGTKHSGGDVEIHGDTTTVTIEISGGKHEHEITLSLEGEEFEAAGDDEEPDAVADGGEDVTDHVDDATIEDAIAQHDDPDHEDALTVDDVRDLLAHIQMDTEAVWGEWMDTIERDDSRVVAQEGDLVVLDTGELDTVSQSLETYDGPVAVDKIAERVVSTIHHQVARQLASGYDWGATYPRVIRLPADGESGQMFVEGVINSLLRRDLSPGQAWAYYAVEIRGHSRNSWASRCGYSDHSAVSEAVRKAKSKLP